MRAMWSGEIAFGLVTIPAKLYTATKDLTPSFQQLHTECGSKINYVRRCNKCDRDVAWEEIGKGYEVSKGQYALFSKEELAGLEGDEGTGAIEIVEFVDQAEIDLAYIEKSYWVGPGGKSARGFFLLRDALESSGKVALAKTKIRTKTRLGLLRPRGNFFSLDMMRFGDELVDGAEIPLPDKREISDKERKLALNMVESMTGHFDASKHPNEYRTRVEELVAIKEEAGELREDPAAGVEASPVGGNVIDLVDLLSKSLEKVGKKGAEPAGAAVSKGGPRKAAPPPEPETEEAKPGPKKSKPVATKKRHAG